MPKNIWLYVSQIPDLAKLGSTFILQGGTQRNLAAVKTQADFIQSRLSAAGVQGRVIVHKHCAESGAIGCAFEAHRQYHELGRRTSFIGLEAVKSISYRTTRNENTRCYFCKNKCLRTFIDVKTEEEDAAQLVEFGGAGAQAASIENGVKDEEKKSPGFVSKVPLADEEQRLIIATCEKGAVEDIADMKNIKKGLDGLQKRHPNLAQRAAVKVFQQVKVEDASDPLPTVPRFAPRSRKRSAARRRESMNARSSTRIGLPRVLNMYSQAPFFMAYFQSLGIKPKNLVWSDFTTEDLYKEGAKRGSIDPCFPSKVGIPHVHDLLYAKHDPEHSKGLDYIFFPMLDSFPTWLDGVEDSRACPTVAASPEATHAAFTKESDLFAERGIVFKKTFLNLDNGPLAARQMEEDWGEALGISTEESLRATQLGLAAMSEFKAARRKEARAIIGQLEAENRLGIVLLARPYHNDPGINHGICEEFQKLGYPVIAAESLPLDDDIVDRLFGEDVRSGVINSPFDINDVWKNSYSENTSRKLWSAKYVARHPNLVALEFSNFKCGHDAPIYTVIEEIVENSRTPFFYFKDIDENKPTGAIKIRVETIAYFLARFRERLLAEDAKRNGIERELRAFEERLRAGTDAQQLRAM